MVSLDIEFIRAVATTIISITPAGVRKYFGNYDYYLEKSRELEPGTGEPARTDAGANAPDAPIVEEE